MKKQNEIVIIIVMGVTGAGKTRFVDLATRPGGVTTSNHKLEPGPQIIRKVPCEHPGVKGRVILVDTPGFDSSMGKQPISTILDVAKSLKKTYGRRVKLVRVIYLHRISDNRQDDSPLDNLSTFARLGNYRVGSVVLATTMWDNTRGDSGERREALLRDKHWEPALKAGSKLMRFQNSYDSAWDIIKSATGESSTTLHEMLSSSGGSRDRVESFVSEDREIRQKERELKGRISRIFGDSSCVIM